MFFKNKAKEEDVSVKILGEHVLFVDQNTNSYFPRYLTRIYFNPNDIHFLPKLADIGFKVEGVSGDCVAIFLPSHWTHIRLDKTNEIIVDTMGRIRLKIDLKQRKTTLLRRFNFGIESVQSLDNKDINVVRCYFTDCDKLITGMSMTDEEYNHLWELSGYSQDRMLEICIEECEKILYNNFPEWQDESAYWSL